MCADRVSRVPGRYQFSMPERPSRDGWFRIGTVDVTTTALLVGLGVLSMFLYAIGGADGPIFDMYFIAPLVREGEIWRLVTWPIANPPTRIWVILTLAFFWFVGHRIEDTVGRIFETSDAHRLPPGAVADRLADDALVRPRSTERQWWPIR